MAVTDGCFFILLSSICMMKFLVQANVKFNITN